jgi:hypothetical protein
LSFPITIRADAVALEEFLSELLEILSRRGSVPEFLERVSEIARALPDGIEFFQTDDAPAGTGEARLALNVAQPLLDRIAALRAFDLDFDLIGQVHG